MIADSGVTPNMVNSEENMKKLKDVETRVIVGDIITLNTKTRSD